MALNEPIIEQSSIANDAYLTVQPLSGDAYMIVNVWSGGAFEIYMYDGTNEVLVEEIGASPYSLNLYKFFVNNSYYMKIKNVSGGTVYVGYSGMQILD